MSMIEKKPDDHEGLKQAWEAFSFLGSIGIYFAVVVGIFLFLGNLADNYLQSGHQGKFAGIIIGVFFVIWYVSPDQEDTR
jgi:Na+/proline symporter